MKRPMKAANRFLVLPVLAVLAAFGAGPARGDELISVFNSSTNWVAPSYGIIKLLVVGGGGGGADGYGGGGGGGGVSYGTFRVPKGSEYTVTVGAGGAHGWGLSSTNGGGEAPQPQPGGTSSFIGDTLSLSATGGLGAVDSRQSVGAASGSGTRNGTFVPGYAGGYGFAQLGGPPPSISFMAGGGGGAGGAGYAAEVTAELSPVRRADGGDGLLLSSILGGVFSGGVGETFVAEALAGGGGGGGGGIYPYELYAALIGTNAYGGGSGSTEGGPDATAGIANTGGGGGGGQNGGADGGSGVVALSFQAVAKGTVISVK